MRKLDMVKIRLLVFPVLIGAVLFGSAGRLDLPFVWAYIGVLVISSLVARFTIDPGLLQERLRPGPGSKDRLTPWLALPFVVVHWIIAGLDVGRFHWSDAIPGAVQAVCVGGLAASLGIAIWAMNVNPFFSRALRIQKERGHHLITAGPYQYVRHPGYVATILSLLFGGFALGSWLGMLPLAGCVAMVVRRTAIEDRFLQEELPGYSEYAQKVPYRLLPGVW